MNLQSLQKGPESESSGGRDRELMTKKKHLERATGTVGWVPTRRVRVLRKIELKPKQSPYT